MNCGRSDEESESKLALGDRFKQSQLIAVMRILLIIKYKHDCKLLRILLIIKYKHDC